MTCPSTESGEEIESFMSQTHRIDDSESLCEPVFVEAEVESREDWTFLRLHVAGCTETIDLRLRNVDFDAIPDLDEFLRDAVRREVIGAARSDRIAELIANGADIRIRPVVGENSKVGASATDVEGSGKDKPTVSRRWFVRAAAVIALALSAGVVGGSIGYGIRGDRARAVGKREKSRLDKIHTAGGDVAIQGLIAVGTQSEIALCARWIAESRKSSLYGDLVALAGHPTYEVRMQAIVVSRRIPPVDLKPHISILRAQLTQETEPSLEKLLARLIRVIDNA